MEQGLGISAQSVRTGMVKGESALTESKMDEQGFPGGAVVRSLPASAGEMGLSPGLGRSHMLWSN